MNQITKQILAYGNCEIVRFRGKAAYGKDMSDAAAAAMPLLRHEESAEAGVVVMQSVSSRRRVTRPVKFRGLPTRPGA